MLETSERIRSPSTPLPLIPQKRGLHSTHSAGVRQKVKVTRACDICKSKKSKCSGEQPCESCSRRGLTCQYEAVYSRGRPPPPRQVEPIGPTLLDCSELLTTAMPTSSTPIVLRPTELVEHIQDVPSRGSPGLEVAGQYSDPTSGLSFLHRAWRRISNNENSQVMAGQLGSSEDDQLLTCAGDKPFQKSGSIQMPSLSQGRNLLDLYFDVCIATYRILHRPSVEVWCDTVLTNAQSGWSVQIGVGNAKAAVVLSVLAIASFHEEKTRRESTPLDANSENDQAKSMSDELFCEASRLIEEESGFPRLESVQSRLAQVLYLLMSSRFNQAWYTFGHTLQIISALGLHRRDDRKRTLMMGKRDYIEEQCRRRTFWVAYILDKYLGIIFGRPRHYHDDDIDQNFPDPVNDKDMLSSGPQIRGADDCHLDSLICHAKLAQISEKISREVYSIKAIPNRTRLEASHRLGAELRQWKSALPPFLGAINPSSLITSFRRQATALKLSYCHAVMLAHRPFLLKSSFRNDEEMRMLAKESLTECISAAQSVLEAVDRMACEGRLFHAFWWTHYVCFCALVIIYVWAIQESNNDARSNECREILDQAERCLSHLAQATATNSPSRKYSIILQELRGEAKRKTARPIQDHPDTLTSTQLADRSTSLMTTQNASSVNENNAQQMRQPLFGSPIDTAASGLQNFLDDWQTTDWLHLDSSAFGPFPDIDNSSLTWM
ncbi:fungal-specific transcription factor domain-containing protein [Phaeosphaeriaceae sp. PMI808]|nr:fungal-specific transcription factor domain-containing protein [Phaeosphaeriaceae sp. PMI808]